MQVQHELNQKISLVHQEVNCVIEEWKLLGKEKESFKKAQEKWEALATKLNKAQIGSRIKLDIGGQIFVTSLNTLTSQKGSFFEAMFAGRWDAKAEHDGCYFIDRDPIVFRHILNYLRGQLPPLDLLSAQELQQLKLDADFYQLPELSEYLEILSLRLVSSTQ